MRSTLFLTVGLLAFTSTASALPVGYQRTTVPLNAPPSGLAYTPGGVLYALENPAFGVNTAVVRVIQPDLSFGTNLSVSGSGSDLYIGSMTYDPVTGGVLITDNAGAGAVYSLAPDGTQTTILSGLANVAGVAVRANGETYVSTAASAGGKVYQIDRSTHTATEVLGGLGFGSGLAFDKDENLIVQDSDASFPYAGRLQKIANNSGTLQFGSPTTLATGMTASAGVIVDSESDLFVTGSGGLFEGTGMPLSFGSFDVNSNPFPYSTAITFFSGNAPFEPFAGGTSRLAFLSDFGFDPNFVSNYVTIISPVPEPASAVLLALGALGCLRWSRRRGMYGAT
jgi:hypothetical protein